MKVTKDNYYSFIDELIELPNIIDSMDKQTFDNVFTSDLAKKHKNIIYMWKSQKPVPRLNGESNILYIGQTAQTFCKRYSNYFDKYANSKANYLKLSHIIKLYGGITTSVYPYTLIADNIKKAEGQMLWWYFQNHGEYPPINYTQTKERTDCREIQLLSSLNPLI